MNQIDSGVSVVEIGICPNPIFILGAPRSGTTILADSLARHSRLWASDESEFLLDLFGRGHADAAYDRTNNLKGGSWIRTERVDRREFLQYLGHGVNALYVSRSGGKRWVDHTNLYTLIWETLADMFPGAYFLHALRDGRNAVHSTLHFANRLNEQARAALLGSGRLAPWAADFREACQCWARYVDAAINCAARLPSRCLTVSHEQLSARPEEVFRTVLEFIGVDHEEGPINHCKTNRINTSFPKLYRGGSHPARPGNPWCEWDVEQKLLFLVWAGQTMKNAGYLSQTEFDGLVNELSASEQEFASLARAERLRPRELKYLDLQRLNQLRAAVDSVIPPDATVVVVSKGDERLVELGRRTAWHFPQAEEGWYAGYHPGDSAEAITMLKRAIERGARFLILPWASQWWMDYYTGFRSYLEEGHRLVFHRADCCTIYGLT